MPSQNSPDYDKIITSDHLSANFLPASKPTISLLNMCQLMNPDKLQRKIIMDTIHAQRNYKMGHESLGSS